MKAAILFLFSAGLATAQFVNLSTDAGGSQVRFVTDRNLRGAPALPQPAVFAATAAGVQPVPAASGPVNYSEISGTTLSDGGDVAAWSLRNSSWYSNPPFGGGRAVAAQYLGMVQRRGDGRSWSRAGQVSLSRNGRWALFAGEPMDVPDGTGAPVAPAWIDLWTDQQYPGFGEGVPNLADDGTGIGCLNNAGSLTAVLLKPGSAPEPLAAKFPGCPSVVLDRYARLGVLQFASSLIPESVPYLFELSTRTLTPLAGSCVECSQLSISGEGTRVLVAAKSINGSPNPSGLAQAWVFDIETRTWTRASDPEERVLEAVLSADGSAVLLSTGQGRIVRVDLFSRARTELVASTAFVNLPDYNLVPGSRYTLRGSGLRDAVVTVAGRPVEVVTNENGLLEFLAPKELPVGQADLVVDHPESPFAPVSLQAMVATNDSNFVVLRDLGYNQPGIAILPFVENGTRGGLVAEGNGALPGEELWIWMRGISKPELVQFEIGSASGGSYAPLLSGTVDQFTDHPGWQRLRMTVPERRDTERIRLRIGGLPSQLVPREIVIFLAAAQPAGSN
ncbi:MAG: hypothetical protein J0H49_23205 [Acidobacteria bacterium]|nr:hypothetical protein [Acidobacteriota bacterium]